MKDLNIFKRHFMWLSKSPCLIIIPLVFVCWIFFTLPLGTSSLSPLKCFVWATPVLLYVITFFITRIFFITVNKQKASWGFPAYAQLLLILKDNTPVLVKDVFWGKGKYVYISGLGSGPMDITRYFSYIRDQLTYTIEITFRLTMKSNYEWDPKILYHLLLDVYSAFDEGVEIQFSKIITWIVIHETEKQKDLFGEYLDQYLLGTITGEDLTDRVWKKVTFPKERFDGIDKIEVYVEDLSISRQI